MRFARLTSDNKVMNVAHDPSSCSLSWDYYGATDFLVIKGKYGSKIPRDEGDSFFEALSAPGAASRLLSRQSAAVLNFEARLVSEHEYLEAGRYRIPDQAAHFGVFAATLSGSELTVYLPNHDAEIYECSVKKHVYYRIAPEAARFLRPSAGRFSVFIEPIEGYAGGLFYTVTSSGAEYPIMPQMLGQTFFVASRPGLGSHDPGLTL